MAEHNSKLTEISLRFDVFFLSFGETHAKLEKHLENGLLEHTF